MILTVTVINYHCTLFPGLLQVVKKRVSLPVFVMIRARGGDFLYTDEEIEVMKHDLKILKEEHADGFVFGFLQM